MWKPALNDDGAAHCAGTMAHRRQFVGCEVLYGLCIFSLLGSMLFGSVIISNRVTSLRTEIARLENERTFLEAGSAELLFAWNKATNQEVITSRARRELGLITSDDPVLVLVPADEGTPEVSRWRKILENVGGADAAHASEVNPNWVMGSMISLTPRDAGGD
ncbi:MAG: hypothetical protein ACI9UQ_001334 [Candidatus Krumholzibacteriia bacterium]|jgi:hypothetical protein